MKNVKFSWTDYVVLESGTGEPTEESAGQAPKLLTVAMSV